MKLPNVRTVVSALRPLIDRWEQEECFAITLNSRVEVINIRLVGIGDESSVIFAKRVICRQAILDLAKGVIVAHTHPSGDPRPSKADIKETESLHDMLNILEIPLIDHIIIAQDKSYSFTDSKVINA